MYPEFFCFRSNFDALISDWPTNNISDEEMEQFIKDRIEAKNIIVGFYERNSKRNVDELIFDPMPTNSDEHESQSEKTGISQSPNED